MLKAEKYDIKGKIKKFDIELFNNNDPKARKVVKKYFKKYGFSLEDNLEKYGPDLFDASNGFFIEVERREVWKNEEFPFEDVHLPERKAKYFLNSKLDVHYVIISENYKYLGIIFFEKILPYLKDKYLKESSNKFIRSGENFFKIPKEEFIWVKI